MRALCWIAAVVLAGCVTCLYPPIATHMTRLAFLLDGVAGLALFAAIAAESRIPRGNVGPLWMRVKAAPKLAMALGLSFTTTLVCQMIGWSFGPVDPNFSSPAPPMIKTFWFFMFTIGFSGIGMMAAPSTFLGVLGPPARWLKRAPAALVLGLYAGVGAGIGIAFGIVLHLKQVADVVARVNAFVDAHSMEVTLGLVALTVGPALLPSKPDSDDDDDE
jgi:hypothetical protein